MIEDAFEMAFRAFVKAELCAWPATQSFLFEEYPFYILISIIGIHAKFRNCISPYDNLWFFEGSCNMHQTSVMGDDRS